MTDIYEEEFMNAFARLIKETTAEALLVHDTKLEDRIDDLESQASDLDDRIEVIDGAFAPRTSTIASKSSMELSPT